MTEVQPMKMAAAEALYNTEELGAASRCSPSAASSGNEEKFAVKVPGLLSFLATGHTDGTVEGINELRAQLPEDVRRGPRRDVLLPGRLHPRSSRSPTGASG